MIQHLKSLLNSPKVRIYNEKKSISGKTKYGIEIRSVSEHAKERSEKREIIKENGRIIGQERRLKEMCEVAERMKKSEELKNEHYEFIVDKFFEGEKEKFENASFGKMRDVYDKLCDEEEGRAIAVCNGKEETDEDRIVYDLVTCLGNILHEIHMEKLNAKE